MWQRRAVLVGALVVASMSAAARASESGWRVVASARGITVSVRDEPGRGLPSFRGHGTIEGDVSHVLSAVLDTEGAMAWAEGTDKMSMLRELGPRQHLIYSHTDTPWPIRDRDMVMKRKVEVVKPGRVFRLRLDCVKDGKEPIPGCIRIHDCSSEFVLRKVDAEHTAIDYWVRIDPRGILPKWFVAWSARKVPFDTLVNLEAHVKKTGAKYDETATAWAKAQVNE
jgi:START domain